MEDNKPNDRHKELSLMFLEMGNALVSEGLKNKDFITASLGNSMILMGTITFDKNEVKLFGELGSMLSAKQLVRSMSPEKQVDPIKRKEELKKFYDDDPFQQIYNRIRKTLDNDRDNEGK